MCSSFLHPISSAWCFQVFCDESFLIQRNASTTATSATWHRSSPSITVPEGKRLRANPKLKLEEEQWHVDHLWHDCGTHRMSEIPRVLTIEGELGSFRIGWELKMQRHDMQTSYPTIMLPGTPNHSEQRIPFLWSKNSVGLWNSNVGAWGFPKETKYKQLQDRFNGWHSTADMTKDQDFPGPWRHLDGQDQSNLYISSKLAHTSPSPCHSLPRPYVHCRGRWEFAQLLDDQRQSAAVWSSKIVPASPSLCDCLPSHHGHCRGC